MRGGSAGFRSACSVNALINCDLVAGSSYAELVMGFPLAGFVAGWYLAVAILAALSFAPSWRKAGVCAIAVMAGVSCAFSLVYTGVMVF
ncbi:vitamin K epoxide reductase family protein, partial [Acinetobacter baumannii]